MRRSSGQAIVHWGAAYATTAIASGIIGMNGIVCGEAGDAPFPFLRLLALTSLTLAAALLCCVAALLAYASERGRY